MKKEEYHVRKSENIKHKKITSGLKDVKEGIKTFFSSLSFSFRLFSIFKEDLETKFGEIP